MTTAARLLIVDDEPALRHLLHCLLTEEGFACQLADSAPRALQLLRQQDFDLVLCDIRMPGGDGLSFLRQALADDGDRGIVLMSAYGDRQTALDCIRQGAYDYIAKPFANDDLLLVLRKALERRRLRQENRQLRRNLREQQSRADNSAIVHAAGPMSAVLQQVQTLAQVASPVLIRGETGTGKELIARALHQQGPRAERPFIALNCSAIAANLIESELFGHAKGAFTGADRARPGLFSAAHGGTLFLDEIAELPLTMQPKLLRVLQEAEVRPVGETRPRTIDVRIVAATACDLKQAVAQGRFREDLFYRLAVVELQLPALRQRPDDIAPLSRHILKRCAAASGRPTPELSPAALEVLRRYPWPGNVRELHNLLERVLIFHRDGPISPADLPAELHSRPDNGAGPAAGPGLSLKQAIASLEQHHIRAALQQTGGNRTQAARLLDISLRALHYKIREYQL
ncbi:sigma-54-dependent transcriptional regulator [Desulfuromonas thiophila]|uniref:sigma-54-dependent transcriptional regulator n=1 Tax=Desulfuromonas thiophila TaxID=57664 RepID=UPI0024A88E41|nr:sigma-54 dependent transcriptional regulator [Desulfuromonas thiophila]